jgi:RNA polymerase sigma-54 factor
MGYIRRSVPDMVDDMAFTQGIYTDERWCKNAADS